MCGDTMPKCVTYTPLFIYNGDMRKCAILGGPWRNATFWKNTNKSNQLCHQAASTIEPCYGARCKVNTRPDQREIRAGGPLWIRSRRQSRVKMSPCVKGRRRWLLINTVSNYPKTLRYRTIGIKETFQGGWSWNCFPKDGVTFVNFSITFLLRRGQHKPRRKCTCAITLRRIWIFAFWTTVRQPHYLNQYGDHSLFFTIMNIL